MIAGISVRPYTATITAPSGWTLVRRVDFTTLQTGSLAVYIPDSRLDTIAPVSGTPSLMRDGYDDRVRISLMDHDRIRETSKQEALYPAGTGDTRHAGKRNDILLEDIERRVDRFLEIGTQTGPFPLVPRGSLFRGRFVDPQRARQPRLIRARIRLLNSSRSMSRAVPASI